MEAVGELLKSARKAKQMSVSDIAEATQMQEQTICAIERDDFDALPAPLYVRGFIKMYARCVDIDPVPLINAYNLRIASGDRNRKPTRGRRKPAVLSGELRRSRVPASGEAQVKRRQPLLRFRLARPSFSLRVAAGRWLGLIKKIDLSRLFKIRLPRPDIAKLTASLSSGVGGIIRKMQRLPVPRFRVSAETRRIIPIAVLAVVLLIIAVYSLSWYAARSRPRVFDAGIVQQPPEPYIE